MNPGRAETPRKAISNMLQIDTLEARQADMRQRACRKEKLSRRTALHQLAAEIETLPQGDPRRAGRLERYIKLKGRKSQPAKKGYSLVPIANPPRPYATQQEIGYDRLDAAGKV